MSTAQAPTLDALNSTVAGLVPESDQEIFNLLSALASAILIGALGPVVSPAVAFIDSAEAIVGAPESDDWSAAWQALSSAAAVTELGGVGLLAALSPGDLATLPDAVVDGPLGRL